MYATDGTTFISGIGLGFGLLMSFLMIVSPRRYALLPVIAMICFMTMGQRVMVLGLNFTLIRIVLLFGLLRIIARGEVRAVKLNGIDRILIWWVMSSVITYTILWGTGDAFVNRVGLAYNALGLFFLFRALLRDLDDVLRVVKQMALLVVPLAACMAVEKTSGHNPFAIFGGVPPETIVRAGVLRCQGPFAHPILAGAFGSAILPLFVGLWWQQGSSRLLAFAGIVSSVIITVAAGSSGPVMGALLGLVGICFWPVRQRMRVVRRGIALALLSLHLVMKAPVWFLLARVGVFSGSTGYHRAILIDHAVDNFWEWWLVGTYSTAHWGYYMFDITNQYVLIGVEGGLVTLVLFVAIIVRCFGAVGRAVRALESASRDGHRFIWALGASLLVHVANYISVPYFDQNIVNWYLLLAMIAVASSVTQQSLQDATQSESGGKETVNGLPPALGPSKSRLLSRVQRGSGSLKRRQCYR